MSDPFAHLTSLAFGSLAPDSERGRQQSERVNGCNRDDAKENNQTMLTTVIRLEPNMCRWYHIVFYPHWRMEGTNGQRNQPWALANSLVAFSDYE